MNKLVYIVSLGCAKNLVDTELAAGALAVNRIGFAGSPEDADIYFINTCAFISPARDEASEFIEEAVQWKKADPGKRQIIVGGCLPQWDKKGEFIQKYPEVDLWIPVDEVHALDKHILSLAESATPPSASGETANTASSYLYDEKTPRLQLTPPHFAYLKIAEGCKNLCSYCTIPGIRGSLRCRSVKSVVKEAENLIKNGTGELILAAQDTAAFRDPDTGEELPELIKALDALPGKFKIRVLYLHPAHLSDAIIHLFGTTDHLLPYIDLPIQHISDTILKSMKRNITACEIRSKIEKLRKQCPEIAIRTTLLLGYPGETEKDFEELCSFIKEMKFARLGVFPYCMEPDTPAAEKPDHVPTETAQKRCEIIMKIQEKISSAYNRNLIGNSIDVVIDNVHDDAATGRTYMDAPDIDNTVEIINPGPLRPGENVRIEITDADAFTLTGKMV